MNRSPCRIQHRLARRVHLFAHGTLPLWIRRARVCQTINQGHFQSPPAYSVEAFARLFPSLLPPMHERQLCNLYSMTKQSRMNEITSEWDDRPQLCTGYSMTKQSRMNKRTDDRTTLPGDDMHSDNTLRLRMSRACTALLAFAALPSNLRVSSGRPPAPTHS